MTKKIIFDNLGNIEELTINQLEKKIGELPLQFKNRVTRVTLSTTLGRGKILFINTKHYNKSFDYQAEKLGDSWGKLTRLA